AVRPRPRSRLFPYTTLFRSGHAALDLALVGGAAIGQAHVANAAPVVVTLVAVELQPAPLHQGGQCLAGSLRHRLARPPFAPDLRSEERRVGTEGSARWPPNR